ncbi:hypothetical protein [Brassicibacter mesophilus]|uniref:fluoroquinolone export ABC transporter permease subunit n=1 Tax=Brassicibacter mesophilus TaxID=745119 RepID=UPI003D222D23
MKKLIKSIKGDLFLQFKYGFYAVYLVITVFYIILLIKLPVKASEVASPFIIFSDPSILGFYFIGALILLEKAENTIEYLIITPLKIKEYLLSKMISLTILSLLVSITISVFIYKFNFNIFLLAMGVTLTSFLFILIGFIAVAKFQTINDYILTSIIYITILCLPILDYFGLYRNIIFYLFPTKASLLLVRGSFAGIELWEVIYSTLYLIVCIFITYKWAYRSFYRFIILKQGER